MSVGLAQDVWELTPAPRTQASVSQSCVRPCVNSSEEVSMDYSGGATHRLDGVPALLRVQAALPPLCGGPDTCCLPH